MKTLDFKTISDTVCQLLVSADLRLPQDICDGLICAAERESGRAKSIIGRLIENAECADKMGLPVCQDTGAAVVFAKVGTDVHIDCDFEAAINDGVRRGYEKGCLRASIVSDPLRRVNTGNNTPAIIHVRLTAGDKVEFTVAPKGFGSENMSAIKMFLPSASADEIVDFVVNTAKNAGANACPPMVIGVGIGSDFEGCALLAKTALVRSIDFRNADGYYAQLEQKMLDGVNSTGIGPQGFGGKTTALAVNIEFAPTHIAGLPVAVNIGCHINRHASAVI